MKVFQVYNQYRSGGGGETVVVRQTADILKDHSHAVRLIERDSRTIITSREKISAFAKGVYSWEAKREMADIIERDNPDVVHVHNLYPLFSPSVLAACRERGIAVVMTVHNFTLTCPTSVHVSKGAICERCLGGREYWCVLKNCRDDLPTSIGYALRSAVARKFGLFVRNTTLFIALNSFAKQRLAEAGVPGNRIVVVPNCVSMPISATDPSNGSYVGAIGRLSPEKGFHTLLGAARSVGLPVRIAGDGALRPRLEQDAPANVRLAGLLDRAAVGMFYRGARFVVIPSLWFEGFPLVVAESMSHGLPTIASRIGGLPEMVDDGVTGLLFEPGKAEDLAIKMRFLWENPELCRRMGRAGREKAVREFGEETYYRQLLAAYKKAIELAKDDKIQTRPSTSSREFH